MVERRRHGPGAGQGGYSIITPEIVLLPGQGGAEAAPGGGHAVSVGRPQRPGVSLKVIFDAD